MTLLELLTLEGALVCDADGILDFDTSVAILRDKTGVLV